MRAAEILHPIERASVDELRSLQLQRLQASLAAAYAGNPAYRAKFDAAGIRPEDCATLEDLGRFPFTTKADLRDAYPFGFFAVPRERLARIHASSGTTGAPTVVGYTKADIDMWAQIVARSIHAAGGRPGMKVHVAYGYGLFTGGLGAHYGAEALGCTVIPMSVGQTQKQIRLIQDFEPDIVMMTPSYMLSLLDGAKEAGLDPRTFSWGVGLFGAEPWTEAMRGEIEAEAGIDATDIYGLSEIIGPGVAQECVETKGQLTIWEDHFYPEIVDPETGAVLPDGEEGELVFTSLTKQAMPIVRYRTRDLTRLLPPAGRTMRNMARIRARSDDMLIVRGINLFPSQIEELVLQVPGLSPHYLIELHRPDRLDEVKLIVEARDAAVAEEEAAGLLASLVREHVGLGVEVEMVAAGQLDRSAGKAVRVVDRRS